MTLEIGLLVALAIAALCVVLMRRPGVSGLEAYRLVREGARLVDVRSNAEFQAGHLLGAVHLPLSELASRVADLGPGNADLVVYCETGHRSGRAARWLRGHGFARVHVLGAMGQWPGPWAVPRAPDPETPGELAPPEANLS